MEILIFILIKTMLHGQKCLVFLIIQENGMLRELQEKMRFGDDSVSISMSEDPGTEDDVFYAMVIPTDVGGGDQIFFAIYYSKWSQIYVSWRGFRCYHSQNNDIGGFTVVLRKLIDGPGSSNPTLLAMAGGNVSKCAWPRSNYSYKTDE